MNKTRLTAQELLNTCVLKYSMVKLQYSSECYNLPSSLSFYGATVKFDDNKFYIVGDFEYSKGDTEIYCMGWKQFYYLEDATEHLDFLVDKVANFEKLYKSYLEHKRLKKIKNDF
jgi:hypothetical protein